MRITIETIPHASQRYPTVGDWMFIEPNELRIRVSEMGDWRKEAAVAVHELVEAILCRNDGVSEAAVDAFDRSFDPEPDAFNQEPGDDPGAPYHRQHCFATAVERMLIAALGVSWVEHEAKVEALP
jgi:hypothetical protein